MEIDLFSGTGLLIAGLIAGFVNTIAGSGSIFTLGIMLFLGISPAVANGTNRFGILTQGFTNFIMFHRKGKIPYKTCLIYLMPALLGAMSGAVVASKIPEALFELIIGSVMVFVVTVSLQKKRINQLKKIETQSIKTKILKIIIFFLLGFYGGFIQLGFGLAVLACLKLFTSYETIESNGLKNFISFIYTIPVFLIFILSHLVLWKVALLLATGQTLGAYVSSSFIFKSKNISLVVNGFLIIMAILTLIRALVV